MYEDQPFLAKFYLNETVYVSSECNNKYRQRHGSLVQKVKANGKYHQVRLYFLNWLQAYIQQTACNTKPCSRPWRKHFGNYKHPALHKVTGFIKRKLRHPEHG